jgi:plasmid stabilization system protein ParE
MAYKVIVNKRGAKRLLDILDYLEENWGKKVAEDFLDKLNRMLTILEGRPFIGSPSGKQPTVRRILLTKHNRVYYRVKGNTVFVLNVFDTGQNPRRNKFD